MGVCAAAVTFDRSEALVISAALDAAGIPNWIWWYNTIWNVPRWTFALYGFRIVVEEAVAVLNEAQANPCAAPEEIVIRGGFFDRVFSFALGYLSGGAPMPLRKLEWRQNKPGD